MIIIEFEEILAEWLFRAVPSVLLLYFPTRGTVLSMIFLRRFLSSSCDSASSVRGDYVSKDLMIGQGFRQPSYSPTVL